MTHVNTGQATGQKLKGILVVGVLAGALAACSNVEPMSYTPVGEIPPGQGAFSGEDGVFTIYDSGRSRQVEEDEEGSEQ
jgi:hypothetical protein